MLAQYRAKGNEDLICNLLLVTPEGCCRSHQHSCLAFLLNSRNKCYKFDLDFTILAFHLLQGEVGPKRTWQDLIVGFLHVAR